MDCDESVVIMSAVRYMLGRSSYGVGCVIDHIKNKKDELTQSNKEVIIRDITEYIKENPKMASISEWQYLINFLS